MSLWKLVPVSPRVLTRVGAPIVALGLLVLAWWVLVSAFGIPGYIVPTPRQVALAISSRGWAYAPDVWTTTKEILLGFAAGAIVGVALATAMSFWRGIREGLYPLLIFSQVVPIFVVSVVLEITLVNQGLLPQILVTALYSFLPIVVSGVDGFDRADPDLVRLLQGAGASRLQIFRLVRFPGALPSLLSGAKLAMVFAVAAAAISEWIGGSAGLGYYMKIQDGYFQIANVFAGAAILTALGACLFAVIALIEYIALPWNRTGSESTTVWRGK
jgi:ABC-type nitrate/sulfonate/bicarbonate transport system permease component